MNKASTRTLAPLTVAALVALSGTLFSASGQEKSPSAPAQKQSANPAAAPLPPDPLRGPKVDDAGVPGETRRFGGPSKDRKDRAQASIPHRAFVRALENMQNSNPDGSLKFNAEQRAYVKKVEDELKADVQTFVNEHRDEIAALPPEVMNRIRQATGVTVQLPAQTKAKPKAKEGREGGGTDATSPMDESSPMRDGNMQDGMMDQDSMRDSMKDGSDSKGKDAGIPPREQARALIEKAPKPADYHARVWQILSEPQRVALRQELEKYRQQEAQRSGGAKPAQTSPADTKSSDSVKDGEPKKNKPEEKNKQAEKKSQTSEENSKSKRGGTGGDQRPDIDSFRGKDGKIDISKLPPRLQERLKNLSDEERANALKRLEEQWKNNK